MNINKNLPLNVAIEIPKPWLESPADGDRNQVMFSALCHVANENHYSCQWNEIAFRSEFLRRSAPDNGFRLSYHSVGDIRHVWRIKETAIPYLYTFDRLGFSGWAETSQFPERFINCISKVPNDQADAFCRDTRDWLIANNLSKYEQNDFKENTLPEDFIFFPLQLRNDIVSQFCFLDPIKVLIETSKISRERKQFLIIKRHPFCNNRLISTALKIVKINNPYIIISNASVNQLLQGCSSVIVANSGVGLEALIHGKPVYSFAKSEYEQGTTQFKNISDLRPLLDNHENTKSGWANKFIYFFLKRMCFDARNHDTIRKSIQVAEHSLREEIWCEKPISTIHKDVYKND